MDTVTLLCHLILTFFTRFGFLVVSMSVGNTWFSCALDFLLWGSVGRSGTKSTRVQKWSGSFSSYLVSSCVMFKWIQSPFFLIWFSLFLHVIGFEFFRCSYFLEIQVLFFPSRARKLTSRFFHFSMTNASKIVTRLSREEGSFTQTSRWLQGH